MCWGLKWPTLRNLITLDGLGIEEDDSVKHMGSFKLVLKGSLSKKSQEGTQVKVDSSQAQDSSCGGTRGRAEA